MTRKTNWICDVCGKEYGGEIPMLWGTFEGVSQGYHDFDLCTECTKAIEAFIRERTKAVN